LARRQTAAPTGNAALRAARSPDTPSSTQIMIRGPRGNTIVIGASGRSSTSGAERLPPPIPKSSGSPPDDRIWRTPTRASLAEVVRAAK
jgi:hypothetical protein